MNASEATGYYSLGVDLAQRVDELCDRFEKALRAGSSTRIEEFVLLAPDELRSVVLRELILVEIGYRGQSGQSCRIEDYQDRFSELEAQWLSSALSSPPGESALLQQGESPERMPTVPGYELTAQIGRGGMGVVYLGRQLGLGRVVAVKTIPSYASAQPEILARFQAEAEAAARLQHPHIVQIYEVGAYEGIPFFSMEYVRGGNLAERIRHRPMAPQAAAELLEQVAQSIHYAHTQGIIHRDLKPENILLAPCQRDEAIYLGRPETPGTECTGDESLGYYEAKITDFGLASRTDSKARITVEGIPLGTPSYMAPEQTQVELTKIGPACDVYGLGAVLYDMLVGRPPFHAATVFETIHQVRAVEPIPLSQLQPGLPRDLETICLKCLHKDAARRYPSAADLAADLRRFLNQEPIRARRVGWHERSLRWCRRNALVASLLAVLITVLLTGMTGVIWQWCRAENNADHLVRERDVAARERARAERHLEASLSAVAQLVTLGEQMLAIPRMQKTGQAALQRVVVFYEQLLHDTSHDPEVRLQAAQAGTRLGRICHALGQRDKADHAIRRSEQLLEELLAEDSGNLTYLVALAGCLGDQAHVLRDVGQRDRAIDAYRRATQLFEQLISEARPNHVYKMTLANLMLNYAAMLNPADHADELELLYRRAIGLEEESLAADPLNPSCHLEYALGLESLGMFYFGKSRYAEAEEYIRKSLEIRQQQQQRLPQREAELYLARSHTHMGRILSATARHDEAALSHQRAERLLIELVGDFPDVVYYRHALANQLVEMADTLDVNARRDEVLRLYREAIRHFDHLASDVPEEVFYRDRVTSLLLKSPKLCTNADERHELAAMIPHLLDHYRHAAIRADAAIEVRAEDRADWALRCCDLAELLAMLDRPSEVAGAFRTALEIDPENPGVNNRFAWWLVICPLEELRNPAEAIERARLAVSLSPGTAGFVNTLGVAQYRAGQWPEAIASFEQAAKTRGSADSWDLFFLAMARWQLRQTDQAREAFADAVAWMEDRNPTSAELLQIRAEAEALLVAER
jgi:serine/threonine protein kinase/Tfp pilus assembly protein PilF